MAGKQSLYEKQLQRIVEAMGTDLVDVMGADLLKKMTPEERLQGLTVDEILAVLSQEDLQNLEPDVKMAFLRLLDPSNGTQQE